MEGTQLYQLHMPTKVYFGRKIWKEALRKEAALLHGTILLVTTGRSLSRLGYVKELEKEIQSYQNGKKVITYDAISANPRLTEVQRGIEIGKAEKVEIVVGFGGGSALDAAKAIAVGITEKEEIKEFFDSGREPEHALPVIAIPTTAGTGSELSKAAILTDEVQKRKNGIRGKVMYPAIAVVDSFFTESVPQQITMETGFDVLAHAIESYVSRAASPYTQMLSRQAIELVGRWLPYLLEHPKDERARERMSFASMIMGMNLGNASTCLPHRMQYPLGAHTDTSHGAGLAALFPAWIGCESMYESDKIESMLLLLTGKEWAGSEACVKAIKDWERCLGLPISLQELGVEKGSLRVYADEVTGRIENDPASDRKDVVWSLYKEAWQEE